MAETGEEKEKVQAYAHKGNQREEWVEYVADFEVPKEFGEIGAVLVENEHHHEMYLDTIVFHGFPQGPIPIHCASWVHSKFDDPTKRVFFTHKVTSHNTTLTKLNA